VARGVGRAAVAGAAPGQGGNGSPATGLRPGSAWGFPARPRTVSAGSSGRAAPRWPAGSVGTDSGALCPGGGGGDPAPAMAQRSRRRSPASRAVHRPATGGTRRGTSAGPPGVVQGGRSAGRWGPAVVTSRDGGASREATGARRGPAPDGAEQYSWHHAHGAGESRFRGRGAQRGRTGSHAGGDCCPGDVEEAQLPRCGPLHQVGDDQQRDAGHVGPEAAPGVRRAAWRPAATSMPMSGQWPPTYPWPAGEPSVGVEPRPAASSDTMAASRTAAPATGGWCAPTLNRAWSGPNTSRPVTRPTGPTGRRSASLPDI
jgi:hypothetical protein